MNTSVRTLCILVLVCVVPFEVFAQFYSPRTEEHDPAQRFFVTELCRQLAWRENISQPKLGTITNSSYPLLSGDVEWHIRFLTPSGSLSKTGLVNYPTNLLEKGDLYYREVFRKIHTLGWAPVTKVQAEDVRKAYWKGALRAKASREESLIEAFRLTSQAGSEWGALQAAELSGLLTHAALPGVAGRVSIDSVVLARAFGWLAFAESASSESVADLYIPGLFLSGRERVARTLLKESSKKGLLPPNPLTAAWNVWLGQTKSRPLYQLVVTNRHLPILMPMLVYDELVNNSGNLLEEFLPSLVERESALSLHNYGPFLATQLGIGAGHFMDGGWPELQRTAWLGLLQALPADFFTMTNFSPALKQALEARKTIGETKAPPDRSIPGLRELSPLLRLGQVEGVGRLLPTAVATDRDLLNYGWEAAGLQMGARYQFVNRRWGIPEVGKAIRQAARTGAEGWTPFFENERASKIANYDASLRRLELVEGLFQLVGFNRHAYADAGPENPRSAQRFARRAYLRPWDAEWQWRTLYDGGASISNIVPHLRWMAQEAGPRGLVVGLRYLASIGFQGLREMPGALEAREALAEYLPQKTELYLDTRGIVPTNFVVGGELKSVDQQHLDQARELERLYWDNDTEEMGRRTLQAYLTAEAYPSVIRFYQQIRSNLTDTISFSHRLGHSLFLLGYFQTNANLQSWAIENSQSGSGSDMQLSFYRAAAKDDQKALAAAVEEFVERYESGSGPESPGRKLQGFLPLLPALADSKSAKYSEALEYFAGSDRWSILRWICVRRFGLPQEDAITFLGGRENEPFLGFLVQYLLADQDGMDKMVRAYFGPSTSRDPGRSFVIGYLHSQHVLKKPAVVDTDLRPLHAKALRVEIAEWLKASPAR